MRTLGLGLGLSNGPAHPWTPAVLGAAVVLWLDPSLTSSLTLAGGGGVQQINDLSGGGGNFTQATTAHQPSLSTIGGRQCLAITGVSTAQSMTCVRTMAQILGSATSAERIIVAQVGADSSVNKSGIHWGSGDSDSYFEYSDNTVYDGFCSSVRQSGNAITPGTLTAPFVQTVKSASAAFSIGINWATNFSTATNTFAPGTGAPGILATPVSSNALKMGEVIVINRSLTAGEQTLMRAYLKSKWSTP